VVEVGGNAERRDVIRLRFRGTGRPQQDHANEDDDSENNAGYNKRIASQSWIALR